MAPFELLTADFTGIVRNGIILKERHRLPIPNPWGIAFDEWGATIFCTYFRP